jgi:hypothetical protein
MPFALDSDPSTSEISDAINYILANFGGGSIVDPITGRVTAPGGNFVGYIYKYIFVKYASSSDGSVNFNNSPTNQTYFGIRNSNSSTESTNPADYIWQQVAGGFGTTKSLWYIATGGRQIQFAVATTAPDAGWLVDPGIAIDLDIVTSGTAPVIAEAFVSYFALPTISVPRSGSPLTPSFSGIAPALYATDKGAIVPFTDAQTDSNVSFVNGSWRIGNSSTTGYGDISYSNITIGNPTDAGDFAQWPNPTAMANSPAYINVPIRYKNSAGVVTQASVAVCQLIFADPGATGPAGTSGSSIDVSGYTSFVQNAGGAYTPTNATLSAIVQNITSPTYSWSISGATPTSATTSSVVVTPTSSSTGVTVTLTVNGSNLLSPLTKTINMPVVYNGAAGQAGANGVMSAFPTIYIWTGSSTPPTRPSTTSTYTWSSGAYTAPSGWSTSAPSNTVAGNYLWSITIPLNATATTTTSTLDWTNVSYPIRAIAYNGANGTDGTNGNNGSNGSNGTRTAVLDVYQWSVNAPTSFPSGTSTYTWATASFTAPSNLNGWSLTPPSSVLGQTLWVARTVYADSLVSATSTITWSTSTALPISASGVNGSRTAFLEVYQWAASTPTVFPSGTSTYTWANGSFTTPSTPNGWSINPGASVPGFNLYACSVSYSDTNTTSTSTVNWTTSTAYIVGYAGGNGTNGLNGAATFVITRVANDSSAPTNAEVNGLLGRNPVAGDICTVSYNNYNNAVVYQYITSWTLFTTYITGSLIVQNTITADKMVANTMSSDNNLTRNLTVRDNSGNIILSSSQNLDYSRIIASNNWLNSNITINSNGTLNGAGGGQVNLNDLGYTGATNATRNLVSYSASAPSSPYTGDIWINTTNSQYIVNTYNGSAWVPASNLTTNTNQLTDGAGLGKTAVWTSVSSRPSNLSALTGSEAIQNSLITLSTNGTLNGAGGGTVTADGLNAVKTDLTNAPAGILNSNVSLGTLGAGAFATLSQITSTNATTYIAGAAIGTAQVGILTANNIGAQTIDATKMAANSITASNAAIANAAVNTLQIAGNAVTIPSAATGTGTASVSVTFPSTTSLTYPLNVFITGFSGAGALYVYNNGNGGPFSFPVTLKYSGPSGNGTLSTSYSYLGYEYTYDGSGVNWICYYSQGSVGAVWSVPQSGTYTFTVACTGGNGSAAIQVLGVLR